MPRKTRVPTYRRHKASGQAVVVIEGKSHYLGVWDSPESRDNYARLISEWAARGRQDAPAKSGTSGIKVGEVMVRYCRFAESYYPPDGDTTSELRSIREALAPVRQLYEQTPVESFGPLALKAVRQRMIDKGWCRSHINHQINRIRRMFRWAVSEELVPASIYEALRCVQGLAKGRCGVRESKARMPAFWEDIQAIKPHCPRQVAAMLELQFLGAMRSCEIRLMRTIDIDRSRTDYWLYRPGSDQGEHGKHKNAWRGQDRVIALGPQAIAILLPWLRLDEPTAYIFRPGQAVEERNATRRASRRTPMTPSQAARTRKKNPRRKPGLFYSANSYAQAVDRACKKARIKFAPYALRHGRKMIIERADSAEAARVVLGQKTIESTQHYGRLDLDRAVQVMAKLG